MASGRIHHAVSADDTEIVGAAGTDPTVSGYRAAARFVVPSSSES
jgi:hypothetical protein